MAVGAEGSEDLSSAERVISRLDRPRTAWGSNELLGFLAFAAAYYWAYRYGRSFSHAAASPFWIPDSILLCALLLNRPGKWWLFVLTALPIRFFAAGITESIPLWFLLGSYAVDSFSGVATAWALRWALRDPLRFETLQTFGIFCLIAVGIVPGLSAFGGAALRTMFGNDFWATWEQWFLGDALAQLIFTPAILSLIVGSRATLKTLNVMRRIELAVGLGGLILATYLAGHLGSKSVMLTEPRFYAPIFFLFWAAIRFGMFGASIGVAVWGLIFASAAASGEGPFTGQSPDATALALQSYLFPRSFTVYFVALSLEQLWRAQEFLRQSEERFRSMANCAPVMLWMAGRDKLCDFFNRGWLEFTGHTMQREMGNGRAEGVHPDDLQHCLETYHSAFDARRSFEMEYRLRRHDGEYRWVLDRGTPRYDDSTGEFIGYVGSAVDITDRKRREENDRHLAHLQRLAALGELAAAIAHELRQPLAAILTNAEVARRRLNSADPKLSELREIIDDILEDDKHAGEVISRIREFITRREPRIQHCDLNSAIAVALQLIGGDATRRQVALSTELAEGLPPVLGDRVQLQQVLLNLAINGIDAMANTPEATRRLTIQTKLNGGGYVEVAVMDRGSGIAPDDLPHLFESFFTTKTEGMGLGLAISRFIIDSHRGRIWAENVPGGGAAFHFTIPVA